MSGERGGRQGRAGEPVSRLREGGWRLEEEHSERLFSLPTARVEGFTRLYEDPDLRAAVREAGGPDHVWRFFFATAVEFVPPLAPGIGSLVKPQVVTESARRFAEDLRERGFEAVQRGTRQTVRVRSGRRARLTDFGATYPLERDGETHTVSIRGYLAVWQTDGFHVAGGAYPESGLEAALGETALGTDPDRYREELLELVRSVE